MGKNTETFENKSVEKGDMAAQESDVSNRVDSTGGESDAGQDGYDDGNIDLRQVDVTEQSSIDESGAGENPLNEAENISDTAEPIIEQPSDTTEKVSQIEPVNGRLPINCEYAGKTYPVENLSPELRKEYPESVKINEHGYPEFSRYAIEKVDIELTGNRAHDFKLANKTAGLESTPEGFSWHHHENAKTMELIPTDIHQAVRHTGGCATSGLNYD